MRSLLTMRADWSAFLFRQCQLKTHETLELAFGGAAGLRVDLELALLAQVVGLQFGESAAFDELFAALLDEGAKHRRLALFGSKVDAIPTLAPVAGGEEIPQQICLLA